MKKVIILLVLVFIANLIFSITVDGFAFLENQTDHSGIEIFFERTAPSYLVYTIYTNANGYYTVGIENGIYDITYSKNDYFSEYLNEQIFYSNTTIPNITLIEHTTILHVPSVFSTIQTAITYAWETDTLLVHPGTYLENINYNGKNIVIGSLFLTTQDTSYISQTVIDGFQNGSVVTFNSGESTNAVLSGFTIQNGSASDGGGIYCNYNSSPSLSNLIIKDNSGNLGAGIYCRISSPCLESIKILSNSASSYGGGIYFLYNSCPYLVNVSITDNSAHGGGGIFCNNSSPSLENVIITENNASGSGGGGIHCHSNSSPILVNVTICDNNTSANGSGIYCNSSTPSLVNTIVSENTGNYGIYVYSGNPLISYSDFYNNETGNFFNCGQWIGVNIATNANGDSCDAYYNIQLEPCFVDTANGDYHLASDSPCIDAGDPTSPFDPDGTIADMGAYFYDQNHPSADFTANIMSGTTPLIIDFSDQSTIGLSGNPILEWFWDFNNDGTIDSNEQNPQWTYYERGYYTVTLTVFDGTYEDTETKEDYILLLNSAPYIQNPLQDFSFDEDTSDSSIDLFSVFDDPDLPYGDSLSFSYSGNDSILIEILNGVVTLTPLPDWFGSENITFTAFDDSLVFIYDDVLVTIINVNDPPEINFPANFTFYEDSLET
ncbi:MAG: PKD domain-containing protein, partial [Armatimonadetes bacterium]|nr:PKD domain-containing protein [Armatimonadota bacterium]